MVSNSMGGVGGGGELQSLVLTWRGFIAPNSLGGLGVHSDFFFFIFFLDLD